MAHTSPSVEKVYLTATGLFDDSCTLAVNILESGFRPKFFVTLWRGGTPVGVVAQELLSYFGIETDHIAIKTALYTGVESQSRQIEIYGLRYLIDRVNAEDSLLIVDDIFDTGKTVDAVISMLHTRAKRNVPHDIRVATVWYKPGKNVTGRVPDYYVHTTEKWVVFPHELLELETHEIMKNKPKFAKLLTHLESITQIQKPSN